MGTHSLDAGHAETLTDSACLEGLHEHGNILRMHLGIIGQSEALAFENRIGWDVDTLCAELAQWMLDDDAQPASTSLVGILSSLAFEKLIVPLLGPLLSENICTNLRLFVELSSALYCSNGQIAYAGCRSSELWGVQAYVGTKVLQSLDVAMTNVFSAKASLAELKALFLALLATIIAVSYSRPWNHLADVSILKLR